MKCAEQEMDIFKQTEKSQLCEPSFLELRTCQTQPRFPETWRNPISDGFLGSSTEVVSSHVLQLPREHLWLGSSCTREKGGPEIRGELQLCLLLHHRPWDDSAASPNKPGQSHCSTWQGNREHKHNALRWQDRESQGQTDAKALQRRTGKEWTQWHKRVLSCCSWCLVPWHVSIPCSCCHWIVVNHPRKAQLAHGGDSLPWEGCLLQFLPLQKISSGDTATDLFAHTFNLFF